jgi:hypothetical protein
MEEEFLKQYPEFKSWDYTWSKGSGQRDIQLVWLK